MKFFALALLLCIEIISIDSKAYGDDEFLGLLESNIPSRIKNTFFSARTLEDVKRSLGKPDLIEAGTYFYIVEGFKYSLSISSLNGNLTTIRFRLPKSGDKYSQFHRFISHIPKKIEDKNKHSGGRYFSMLDQDRGYMYVFKNTSEKKLHSITRYVGKQ